MSAQDDSRKPGQVGSGGRVVEMDKRCIDHGRDNQGDKLSRPLRSEVVWRGPIGCGDATGQRRQGESASCNAHWSADHMGVSC